MIFLLMFMENNNTNVCCVKNNLPKWFYGEMIESEKCNALKNFAEIHLTLSMKNSLAIEFGRCSTNTGDGMVLKLT